MMSPRRLSLQLPERAHGPGPSLGQETLQDPALVQAAAAVEELLRTLLKLRRVLSPEPNSSRDDSLLVKHRFRPGRRAQELAAEQRPGL